MNEQSSELFVRVRALQASQAAMHTLAEASGVKNAKTARKAFAIAAPQVLEALGAYSRSDHGPVTLQRIANSFDITQRRLPARVFSEDRPQGSELSQHLFGPRLPTVAEQVADKAAIGSEAARAIVQNVSAACLAITSGMVEDTSDLRGIPRVLLDHGPRATPSGPTSALGKAAAAAAAASGKPFRLKRSGHVFPAVDPEPTEPPDTDRAVDDIDIPTPLLAAGAAMAALLIILGVALRPTPPTEQIATPDTVVADPDSEPGVADMVEMSTTDQPTELAAQPSSTGVATAPPSSNTGDTGSEPPEVLAYEESSTGLLSRSVETPLEGMAPGIVAMQIPLRDILVESPGASGAIDLAFNTLTGEICFAINASKVDGPFGMHIHEGDFGVAGPALLDLGTYTDGDSGCVDSDPADTLDILDNPGRHYAELHAESESYALRGQLTERAHRLGIVPLEIPMRDIGGVHPNASGVLSLDVNTLTGELCFGVFTVGIDGPHEASLRQGAFDVEGSPVVDLGTVSSGDVSCVENDTATAFEMLANPSGHYATLTDASGAWAVRGQLTETIDNPGVVSISIPLRAAEGVEADAEATVDLDFNTLTGEICFAIESTGVEAPYNTHIRSGGGSVTGGVVVNFGTHKSGDSGCVANQPADTRGVLSNPTNHFVELHDASGAWTIRGQLSDADGREPDAEQSIAVADAGAGGAYVILAQGIVYLEGNVPDQDAADQVIAQLAEVAVPIVNNLELVPGSPEPTGRVIIADAIRFESNSNDLENVDIDTLNAITGLAMSRPDATLTIVGHTDDVGNDLANLELSLRRASALRSVLAFQGVPVENLLIRGAGESAPIADNDNEEGRALNRRIEFEFTPK